MPRIKERTFKYYKETALAINIRSEKIQFTKDRDLTFFYTYRLFHACIASEKRK